MRTASTINPLWGVSPPIFAVHLHPAPALLLLSRALGQAGRQARVNKQEKLGHGRTREGTKKWDKNNLVDSRARAPYLMETV